MRPFLNGVIEERPAGFEDVPDPLLAQPRLGGIGMAVWSYLNVSKVVDNLLGLDLVCLDGPGLLLDEVFEVLGRGSISTIRGVGRGRHLFVVIEEPSAKFNDGDGPERGGGWCLGCQLSIGLSRYLLGFLA